MTLNDKITYYFFPLLPDAQEKVIESSLNVNEWYWREQKSTILKK